MAYSPKFTNTAFKGGKNILASEHLQFIEGGATFDATKFATGYNAVGKLVARNTTTGKFEDVGASIDLTGYDNFGICNIDFDNDGTHDLIVGEVIVRGSVYENKLADAPTAIHKEANPLIRYVK